MDLKQGWGRGLVCLVGLSLFGLKLLCGVFLYAKPKVLVKALNVVTV